ncbi:MAG TPA: heme anaerobic degradation radical SAM methyltransferase ChuW/HutW [Chthoniobacteraceae bacterium]|nr:heme anaerobic degradation radical SAM methyltransferase ChuW/HutW [Chthoniobacteraceae bacterium]
MIALERYHAAVSDTPHRDAFQRRSPLIPWAACKAVPEAEVPAMWETICNTPREGKTVAYFHIPFCSNHCLFCRFYQNATRRNRPAEYVDALIREIEREAETTMAASGPIHAVYLGGGTPTDLGKEDLVQLLKALRRCLPLAADCEITVEARATGCPVEKVAACLEAGANRFSFGVQSFDTDVRRRLGRKLERRELIAFLREVCALDQAAVVCDLIFGLPHQTRQSWMEDLEICTDIGLSGVDLYCLTVLPSSPLSNAIRKGSMPQGAAVPDQGSLYVAGAERLMQAGWRHLTTAHFSNGTRERNLYNQLIKAGANCLAYGAGAAGTAGEYSYRLTSELTRYHQQIAEVQKPLSGLYRVGAGHGAKGMVTDGIETGRLDLARLERAVPGLTALALPLAAQWEEAGLIRRDFRHPPTLLWLTLAGRFWHTNLTSALHQLIDSLLMPQPVTHMKPPTATQPTDKATQLALVREKLALDPDGILEAIALQNGLTTREVVSCLPPQCVTAAEGKAFSEVMEEISQWGEILLIVHTPDAIIECAGPLPKGSFGHGFFNLGEGSPIRGHIRAANCSEICLVRRPFMGMETCSIQFFNERGNAIFKIFVSRDENEKLKPGQVERFEALRGRLATGAAA